MLKVLTASTCFHFSGFNTTSRFTDICATILARKGHIAYRRGVAKVSLINQKALSLDVVDRDNGANFLVAYCVFNANKCFICLVQRCIFTCTLEFNSVRYSYFFMLNSIYAALDVRTTGF